MTIVMAYLADLLFGDPPNKFHLVAYIGKLIAFAEKKLNLGRHKKLKGITMTALLTTSALVFSYFIVVFSRRTSPLLAEIISVFLLWQCISYKKMKQVSQDIKKALDSEDVQTAKNLVGQIVGRDTEKMNAAQICRATVESISESTVDAFVAPLFFAFLGGVPLAFAYRVVNTMDSMVGYKNDFYKEFGWASARLDDVLNFIPARITLLITLISAFLLKEKWRKVFSTAAVFGKVHASPNSGLVESAAAGALNLKLGGSNYYNEKEVFYGFLGDGDAPAPRDILRSINLFRAVTFVSALLFALAVWSIGGLR